MLARPRNIDEIWFFVYLNFGVSVPGRIFSPGHSSPLHFVADAFLHPGRDVAAWANRSGIKTLGAAILAAMDFVFVDRLHARVLSGSEHQAANLYEYWSRWAHTPPLCGRIEGRVGRQLTRVAGGSFEILAASEKQVRGPKVQRLFRDEIDETDQEVLDASVGMVAGRDGVPGRVVDASTWHRVDGPMARLVADASGSGVSLHKWGIWESLEACPEARHQQGRGCDLCGLAPACRAKAQEYHKNPDVGLGIAAACRGLFKIDDAIRNYRRWSQARWEAEAECRRPAPEGLVYPEFDEGRHRCEDPPTGLTIYRSVDWGHGVFVCLWIGQDSDGTSYLLDTYRAEYETLRTHAEHILDGPLQDIHATFCDPAGRNRNDQTGISNVEQFRAWGIPCTYSLSPRLRNVHNGIQSVRALLKPACGPPRFYYVPSANNAFFVRAMRAYRNRKVNGVWVDEPQDPQPFEHVPDALRYYAVHREQSPGIKVVPLEAS